MSCIFKIQVVCFILPQCGFTVFILDEFHTHAGINKELAVFLTYHCKIPLHLVDIVGTIQKCLFLNEFSQLNGNIGSI